MSNYYANAEEYSTEHSRRKLAESIQDDISIDRFEGIGIQTGWKCLDVGAGAGSMAYWLCDRVGATGKVVATDTNTRFLNSDRYPNLEVRKHDIELDVLEESEFDLIHCRCVLMHLKNSIDALNKMAVALKPNGYILLEEPDFSSFLAEGEPDNSLSTVRYGFGQIKAAISGKNISLYLGRKLPLFLADLNFENIIIDEHCTIQQGGSVAASLHSRGWSILMKQGMAGELTQETYLSAIAYMNDPNFSFRDSTNIGVWACKPAKN